MVMNMNCVYDLGLAIYEGGRECWPLLINVWVGPIHVVGCHAAGTRVNKSLHTSVSGGIEHVPGSLNIGLPHLALQPSAKSVGQTWDNPSRVDDHIWFHCFNR